MRTLPEILKAKNKIAVYRELGGLGDILMHRMIFEDLKELWESVEITFACPRRYHQALIDHKFIDKIIDFSELKPNDYLAVYDTSRSCYRTEIVQAPFVKDHRSDILARTCGIELKNHNMHIVVSEEEIKSARSIVKCDKYALIAPITAMGSKNLDPTQTKPAELKLKEMGFEVFYLHDKDLPEFGKTLHNLSLRDMMAVVYNSDLVVAGDTATFHMAGGMGKKVVGVFGWADLFVYGKYYPDKVVVQKHRELDPEWTCGPCFNFHRCTKCPLSTVRKPCITEITGEMIIEGVLKALNKNDIQLGKSLVKKEKNATNNSK